MTQDSRSGGGDDLAHQGLPGSLWGQLGHDYLEPIERQTAVRRKLQESRACPHCVVLLLFWEVLTCLICSGLQILQLTD
jgi:hypothetical protein